MIGKQKFISGVGDGKWETPQSLKDYRRKRDKKNKQQKKARKKNRG